MIVHSDVRPVAAAPPHTLDGDVVSNGVSARAQRRLSEFVFFTTVAIAQVAWLGGLAYLALRLL